VGADALGPFLAGDGADMRNMPAVLLVGGMGTRLRSVVPSTPKPLASVGNRSFLELLIRQLRSQGIRHLVMCTGYLADRIASEFGDGSGWGVDIGYSKEPHPLGTAGAIKFAQGHLKNAFDFLVMNGDSFLEFDLQRFVRFHREHKGLASMAVVKVDNANRYGTVHLDDQNRVTGFMEKAGGDRPGLINGGVYILNRAVLGHIPEGAASLEKDVFPRFLGHGVYAMEQDGMFIDIGTPEDYARAQQLCDRLYEAALSQPQPDSEP